LAFAIAVALVAGAAQAQQAQQRGAATSTTPGVAAGTTGTTFTTPGSQQAPTTPGGTVPMGASTQDVTNQPGGLRNYNNSGGIPSTRK
jgi:hypothetical protein